MWQGVWEGWGGSIGEEEEREYCGFHRWAWPKAEGNSTLTEET